MNQRIVRIFLRRIISSIIILFLLVSFIFILLRFAPGDPAQKLISPELSPQLAEHVRVSFGLNSPVISQYIKFVSNLLTGDFGISYNYRTPVFSVIMDYLPFTLIFASLSFIIQIITGFWLALTASKKFNGSFDRFVSKWALVVYALPVYVLGVILIYIFSLQLKILPSSDLQSFDKVNGSFAVQLFDYAIHMILPLITLSLGGIVIYYKYLRDNLEAIYNKSFVLNLRAMGINEKELLLKHVIPNAIGPFISVAGVELGILFGGALITEVIFGLPGMGRLTINAIILRDYPLVVGTSFISGVLVILTNTIADLIKVKIDRRTIAGMLN